MNEYRNIHQVKNLIRGISYQLRIQDLKQKRPQSCITLHRESQHWQLNIEFRQVI